MSARSADYRQSVLADAVRAARKSKRLSQASLAAQVGVDIKTISRIETAQMAPNVGILWSIADALGIDAADLLAGRVPATPPEGADVATESRSHAAPTADVLALLNERIQSLQEAVERAQSTAEEALKQSGRRARRSA